MLEKLIRTFRQVCHLHWTPSLQSSGRHADVLYIVQGGCMGSSTSTHMMRRPGVLHHTLALSGKCWPLGLCVLAWHSLLPPPSTLSSMAVHCITWHDGTLHPYMQHFLSCWLLQGVRPVIERPCRPVWLSGRVRDGGFHIWDATDDFSGVHMDLVFDGSQLHFHNARGSFGAVPMQIHGELHPAALALMVWGASLVNSSHADGGRARAPAQHVRARNTHPRSRSDSRRTCCWQATAVLHSHVRSSLLPDAACCVMLLWRVATIPLPCSLA